jgi:hypothetical protein
MVGLLATTRLLALALARVFMPLIGGYLIFLPATRADNHGVRATVPNLAPASAMPRLHFLTSRMSYTSPRLRLAGTD